MAGTKWTPERRAKFQKSVAAKKQAAEVAVGAAREEKLEEAYTPNSILTYLRHAGADIMAGIQRGDITLRTLQRRDALVLLAFTETRGRS